MAKRTIDEQKSYNIHFFLLAGGFALVTFWAIYDETVTRREYKKYQEAFFDVEVSLAKQKVAGEKKSLDDNQHVQALLAQKKAIEEALRAPDAKARIAELEGKVETRKFDTFDKTQTYTFSKSELDEAYYWFTLAKHHRHDSKEKEDEYVKAEKSFRGLEDRVAKDGDAMAKAALAQKAAEAELAKARRADELSAITKELDQLGRAHEDAKRALAKAEARVKGSLLFGKGTEIIQQNLEDIERVDRCQSCHLGAARGGFEPDKVAEQVFQSHPMRRTLLGIHPPEKFGCTTCHDGQGRATDKFYAHAPGPEEDAHAYHTHYWETPLLKGPPGGDGTEYMESKCLGCHKQQWDLRSTLTCEVDAECPSAPDGRPMICDTPQPRGSAEAPHGSVAAADKAAALAAAVQAGEAPAPEVVKMCLAAQPSVKLKEAGKPDSKGWDPAVAADREKIRKKSEAAYVDLAPNLSRGLKVIEEMGCYGCHPIDGYLTKTKPAPDLTRVAHKLDAAWMIEWIKDPKALRPNTRMPRFWPELTAPNEYPYEVDVAALEKQRQAEAEAMVAFLLARSKASHKYGYELEPIPPDVLAAADAERGKKVIGTVGCAACHHTGVDGADVDHKNRATHFDHGPDLTSVGQKVSKEWIYSWVRNPKKYAPQTRMPNLRLTQQEAADVATYLAKQTGGKTFASVATDLASPEIVKYGEKLVKNYGCYGCHMVEGYEEVPGIGAELTEFGIKTVERLDFGDYITDHNAQNWEAWAFNKLKHPRVYAYEVLDWKPGEVRGGRAVMRMPQFDLAPDELRALMVVLKGLRGGDEKDVQVLARRLSTHEQARERGRELVRFYNCYGCHRIDGFEGDIGQLDQYSIKKGNGKYGPPELTGQGWKTQPEWLFGFLKRPFLMRPLPRLRMPTFGFTDSEATELVAMFSAFDGAEYPFRFYSDVAPANDVDRAVGETLFQASNCQQCHIVGDIDPNVPLPEAVVAPNLLMARERLRAEWVNRWLADPGAIMEGTAMPPFWIGKNPLEQAVANTPAGQALEATHGPLLRPYLDSKERQIEAVRNYLFWLPLQSRTTASR